ncbi:MAG: lipopolysaccharide kinase InaA family protein [Phycisphaerae bacterium]
MAMTDQPASVNTAASVKPNKELVEPHEWINRRIDDWHWRIRSDWLALFDSPQRPSWLDLGDDPRASLFKSNEIRDVFRVDTDHGAVFAKIARPLTWLDRLRRLILGPDSLREWRAAEYAANHGIATVVPVAAAWRSTKGCEPASILITLETPDAEQLDTWWLRVGSFLPGRNRSALIDAVAELIARAHHGAFVHADLHAGNILVFPTQDGGYGVCFVDLQAVSIGRRVSHRRAVRNLAAFGNWFRLNASVTDRMRFLRAYLAWRGRLQPGLDLVQDRRRLLGQLERAARIHANAQAAKRDRQALRNGRRFGIIHLDRMTRAHVFLWARQTAPGSALPNTPLTRQWWRTNMPYRVNLLLKPHNITYQGVGKQQRGSFNLELEDGKIVVATYLSKRPNLVQQLRHALCPTREMRLWKTGNALLNRGIPAARPLALCERRCCGLLRYSLVLIEKPTGAQSLAEFIEAAMKTLPPKDWHRVRTSIAGQVGRLFRRLDQEGFVCDRIKVSDLTLCVSESSDRPIVVLSGYLGLRQTRSPVPFANLPALIRLSADLREWPQLSRTDRLRVLKRYLDRLGAPVADWKEIWREIG